MDRVAIKNAAKEKIKGNIWNILWPMLVIGVVGGLLSGILGPKATVHWNADFTYTVSYGTPVQYIFLAVISLAIEIATAGYLKYILNFVRTGKFDTNEIINTVKAKWLDLLIANLVGGLIIGVGFALLVVPGIIAAIALCFVNYIIIDSDTKGIDALKKSYELTNGHKMELFVFGLSFIGWCLLVPFTLGLLLIWLWPYMLIAFTMVYEKLKK